MIPDFENFLLALDKGLPIGLRESAFHQFPYNLEEKLKNSGSVFKKKFQSFNFYEVEGPRKKWGGDIDHHLGMYFMQAFSSLLPVYTLSPQPGERVLDMCAAPGGKSALLSELMQNEGVLICCEPDLYRRRVLKANLNRLNCINSYVFQGKAQELAFPKESFDKILLDGPCSSEGTFRKEVILGDKRREVNYLTYNERFRRELHQEQTILLDKAWELLKPGGVLVYSTCTYDPDENERALQRLLSQYPDAHLAKISFGDEIDGHLIDGFVEPGMSEDLKLTKRVYPHKMNSIGFYFGKVVKSS